MPAYEHDEGVLASSPEEAAELTEQGYDKCRNQLCLFMVSPETLEELYQQHGDNSIPYRCPHCGWEYDLTKVPGRPGGTTNSGLNLVEQAQVGEDLVQALKGLPGYGPFLWFHAGGAQAASAFDAAVKGWGVEIKTVNWTNTPKARRGIIDPQERQRKWKAVQNPLIWAQEMHDPELDKAIHAIGHVEGLLGVLVLLDFNTGLADIFVRPMPHDPDHKSGGIIHFGLYKAEPVAEKIPFESKLPDPRTEGFVPYHQRPKQEDNWAFGKTALDLMGDAAPASQPQAVADSAAENHARKPFMGAREYKFFYGNGELHVSPDHDHGQLAEHARVPNDHTGPTGVGYATVVDGRATWEVNANVATHALERILKDYSKQVGWEWGGLTDLEGEPVGTGSEYAPKKAMHFGWDHENERVLISSKPITTVSSTMGPHAWGWLVVDEGTKVAQVVGPWNSDIMDGLDEWATDFGYKLAEYPGGSNMNDLIKNQQDIGGEDLELHNIYTPSPQHSIKDDRDPTGIFKCPNCSRLFARWREYIEHRRNEEPIGDSRGEPDGKFPELDPDATHPPHFHEREPQVFPLAHVAAKDPKDLVKHPVPVIYDIQDDLIHVGKPGERHSDIEGKFTPGGIVEGHYEPGGKLVLKSLTNMPYSVWHLVDLWYWTHPEFEVTGVTVVDDEGKERKLASQDVGSYLRTLALADPAVYQAYQALTDHGRVYVVGGAVRDALLQKEPKDIDLMVQGVPSEVVRAALEALPGRVDLTGKDFGVFRYKHRGSEVEIALPRRERRNDVQLGEGVHRNDLLDVQADHKMPVDEDLLRRDFTINAMAVDLDTGQLIDPFNGAEDIEQRRLRTVSPKSFEEDALRTVRALVAVAKHSVVPTQETVAQMKKFAPAVRYLASERIQTELDKLMEAPDPAAGIRLAHETGVLQHILPEVEEVWDFDQRNPHHNYPLGEHLVNVLENVSQHTDDPDVRMAALLHDIGKPESAWENPTTGNLHYYRSEDGQGQDHETVGAEMAGKRLRQINGYKAERIKRIQNLIQHHMYPDFSSIKGARKFLNRVGDHADDLFLLRHADRYGKGTDAYQDTKTPIPTQRKLVEKVRMAQEPVAQADLVVSGHELIGAGLQPGPAMGAILKTLTDEVVEDPTKNTVDYLIPRAIELNHIGS